MSGADLIANGGPAQGGVRRRRWYRSVTRTTKWRICDRPVSTGPRSLLYDGGAPTLAPLYDLVSTVAYPELTTRLAMSVGGATRLEAIAREAWAELARDIGIRPAFVTRLHDELLARAAEQAARLASTPQHANPAAQAIAARIALLAERSR